MTQMLTTAARLQGSALSSVAAGAHLYPCQSEGIRQERTLEGTKGNPDTFGKPGFRW
jgi:hypothetical protein